jgi:hypothetical protein
VPYLIGAIVAAFLVGVLLWTGLWWAIPLVLVALVVYGLREARETPGLQRSKGGPEPTGTPRSASGGAETANERVGQT